MDFIKSIGRKNLLIGITTIFIGFVFVGIAITFYIIQVLDSSKMTSLEYEIDKPIAINELPPSIQNTQIYKKEENPQENLDLNSSRVQNAAKISETIANKPSPTIAKLGLTNISSTNAIVANQKQNYTIDRSTTKVNPDSSTNKYIAALPTTTATSLMQSTSTPQPQTETILNTKDNQVLINPSPTPVDINKGFVQKELFSSISSFPFKADALPQKLFIPIIDLSADIKSLNITALNSSLSWETPNKVVGHIPITSTPGELNQGWYFGHYETLLTNEGNIFNDLPKTVDLLKNNNPVFVMINAGDYQFLYQTYKTEVVHQDSLKLTDSKIAEITLVTCVPKYKYDHRLLVTASLIGIRPL